MLKLDITGFTESEVMSLIMNGLVQRKEALLAKIAEIERIISQGKRGPTPAPVARRGRPPLKLNAPAPAPAVPAPASRRPMSDEARARIVAAQKKRWAKVRKEAKQAKLNGAPAPATRTRKSLPPAVMDDEAVESAMEA